MSDYQTFDHIMKIFLERENFKFKKEKGGSKTNSVYYTIFGGKFPYLLRISDHAVPFNRQWTKIPDFNIITYKDLILAQQRLMQIKNRK